MSSFVPHSSALIDENEVHSLHKMEKKFYGTINTVYEYPSFEIIPSP